MSVPLNRFRGALLGALMGDCIGALFEGESSLSSTFVREVLENLDKGGKPKEVLTYTDDTAMTRSMVQSFLENKEFDAKDLADRFTKEYFSDPGRGYGAGVTQVFEKLYSGEYSDIFTPAKEQFNGKGSYGNGAAMRAMAIPLAFPNIADVIEYAKTSGKLTHASSLGYNGAVLQALAVHYALQGESRDSFLSKLLDHMDEIEADEKSKSDAVELELGEFPYRKRLEKIKEFLDKRCVSREDVVDQLGNGVAALESVPTAIYSFLRCMDPVEDLPKEFNILQRTLGYCFLLGGDTDTIATMAGAIAGAYHGDVQVPNEWKLRSESYEDAEKWAEELHQMYTSRLPS